MDSVAAPVADDAGTPLAPVARPGSMTDPPRLSGPVKRLSDSSREAFRLANRYAMVPLHRAGMGAWFGSPFAGWQCLVTTIGRRSGLRRHTPLGYIILDGAAWVLAGYGPRTLWYRNILADPRVELLLPGRRPIVATADDISDPAVRARVIPPLCRSMALPGMMIGCFPPTASDERILECVSWVPLVRIAPADGSVLLPGPDDPGGRGWLWRQSVALGASWLLLRSARRLFRALIA